MLHINKGVIVYISRFCTRTIEGCPTGDFVEIFLMFLVDIFVVVSGDLV